MNRRLTLPTGIVLTTLSLTTVVSSCWLLIAATVLVVWLRSLLIAVLVRHEADG